MNRRFWLSAAVAAIGTSMLVFTAFAGAAPSASAKKGGTLKFNMSATDFDFTDPSLAYGVQSWQVEYATALKLYNYPD
jgi:ABC-type oligopeptide transport system substrate-binding subunit